MPIPKPVRPTRRLLLRDVVFQKLRDAIVSGDMRPGETVNEAEVERWANASRTPVREALDRLAAVRLVDVLPQRGTRVADLDAEWVAQTFSLLGEILPASLGVVAPVLEPEQRRAVDRACTAAERAIDLISPDGLFETIVGVVGNPRLRQAYDELAPHVRRSWIIDPTTAPALDALDLGAVASAAPDRAEAALRHWWSSVDRFTVQGASGEVMV